MNCIQNVGCPLGENSPENIPLEVKIGKTQPWRTCLPDAILEPDRINITLDGISLPVGIWQSVPGASTMVPHLYATWWFQTL